MVKIYECLDKRCLEVRLPHPVKTRDIVSAKIKTDKLDASKLADLLRGGYKAECFMQNCSDDGTMGVNET